MDYNDQSLLVSIICTAYNHQEYIKDALDGFIMQKTTFPFEIIVHDDASTDNTAKIIREYEAKYPSFFSNIYQIENQFSKGTGGVVKIVLEAARGKYIALCEGDDYWIDPYKLQRQVDFLEANPEYSLVHTNGYIKKKNELIPWHVWDSREGDVQQTFYYGPSVRTCTALFRVNLLSDYVNLLSNSNTKIIADWPLFAYYSTKGKFGYLNDRMAVYRYNPSSVSSLKSLTNHFKYSLDAIEVKRFLRDYIFKGKLDDLYSESVLTKEVNHIYLKNAFDNWDFTKAKKYACEKNLNSKSARLAKFANNYLIFLIGCSYKWIKKSAK